MYSSGWLLKDESKRLETPLKTQKAIAHLTDKKKNGLEVRLSQSAFRGQCYYHDQAHESNDWKK